IGAMGGPILEAVLATLEGAGHPVEDAGRIWEAIGNMTYTEARLVSELRRAGPALTKLVAEQKAKPRPPRTAAGIKTVNADPRRQFIETLHWIVTALPKPKGK